MVEVASRTKTGREGDSAGSEQPQDRLPLGLEAALGNLGALGDIRPIDAVACLLFRRLASAGIENVEQEQVHVPGRDPVATEGVPEPGLQGRRVFHFHVNDERGVPGIHAER